MYELASHLLNKMIVYYSNHWGGFLAQFVAKNGDLRTFISSTREGAIEKGLTAIFS